MATQSPMSTPSGSILRVADLANRDRTEFLLEPDAARCRDLAAVLGILGISKLRFAGDLRPVGKSDWVLAGKLGATVQQPCVVSLESVTSRIDTDVARQFLRDTPDFSDVDEREMVEDENIEPLGDSIDLWAILTEDLALSLPQYPRKQGVSLEKTDFAAAGVEPLSDEKAKPFAGLAALRDKLEK